MRTPEGKVKAEVKEFLHSRKVQSLTHPIEGAVGFYWMPVGSGWGSPLLDFVICYRGRFMTLETKRKGAVPTPRQEFTMQLCRQGGGTCLWADTGIGCVGLLESEFEWVDCLVFAGREHD
jgi:hypothetical protein